MADSGASTVAALCVAGVLLFGVPLVTLTNRIDNVTQESSRLIVEKFVTEITNTGKLTKSQYQDFIDKLDATGKTYDVEMEIWHID